MNKVGHDLIEKPLNHSRRESLSLVGPLGHGMDRMFVEMRTYRIPGESSMGGSMIGGQGWLGRAKRASGET